MTTQGRVTELEKDKPDGDSTETVATQVWDKVNNMVWQVWRRDSFLPPSPPDMRSELADASEIVWRFTIAAIRRYVATNNQSALCILGCTLNGRAAQHRHNQGGA